jgi:hypothetical protein
MELIHGTGRPRRKRLSWESCCEIVAKVVEAKNLL